MKKPKEPSQKLLLRLSQKTNLRLVIAGSCFAALSAILLIYFNMTMVKEMKAKSNTNQAKVERPVDMNVLQIVVDSTAKIHSGPSFKIAKPIQQIPATN